MDSDKIGAFIKKLRIENNMSQNDLAEKIPIGRNAISKWECGRTIPDSSTILILSDIFGVSTDEIMCGEYKTKDNEKEVVDIHLQIYDDRNTIKKQLKTRTKILLGSVFLLIFAIFTFLAYYFFNSYDSVKIYTIESNDDKIYLTDGAIVLTGENIYFRLGNINGIAEESISKIIVYYYYNNTKRKIYESDSAKDGLIRDYYEYNEYFEVKNKDVLFNSLYADIYFEKDFKTIKLIMKEDYSNKRFFFQKHKSVLPEHVEPINIKNQNVIEYIREKFTLEKESSIYQYKIKRKKINYDIFYSDDTNILTILWKDKMQNYSIEYSFANRIVFYKKSDNSLNVLDSCSYEEQNQFSNCDISIIDTYNALMNEIIKGRS